MECPVCFETFDDQLERCPYCKTKIKKSTRAISEHKKISKSNKHLAWQIILILIIIALEITIYLLLNEGDRSIWWMTAGIAVIIICIILYFMIR